MRKIELINGIYSSALGFGCAPVLGSVGSKRARMALDCALDLGINHFDLARSYGYGEAESFFGKLIKGRRNQIVIASKFGIQANWKAKFLRPVKPVVRFLKKGSNSKRSTNGKTDFLSGPIKADKFHTRIPITKQGMLKSLDNSLKALGTTYLDYLFIHEPHESIMHFEDLMDAVECLKKEGKIRAFGLSYMRYQEQLHGQYLDQFEILQLDASPGALGYDNLITKRGLKSNIIFSPLRGGDVNLSPSLKLQQLFIDFPNSVVLCSMFNVEHLKANVNLLNNPKSYNA